MKGYSDEEKYLQTARMAIVENLAEVIVLGCAGLTGLNKHLQNDLGVPVLDGVICALIIAAGSVRYGISTSKIRRYNPNWT
ncbi:MAG: aspartate/glutamate racemase family protein [Candidatus Odinarchaeota archaeon]